MAPSSRVRFLPAGRDKRERLLEPPIPSTTEEHLRDLHLVPLDDIHDAKGSHPKAIEDHTAVSSAVLDVDPGRGGSRSRRRRPRIGYAGWRRSETTPAGLRRGPSSPRPVQAPHRLVESRESPEGLGWLLNAAAEGLAHGIRPPSLRLLPPDACLRGAHETSEEVPALNRIRGGANNRPPAAPHRVRGVGGTSPVPWSCAGHGFPSAPRLHADLSRSWTAPCGSPSGCRPFAGEPGGSACDLVPSGEFGGLPDADPSMMHPLEVLVAGHDVTTEG